LTIVTGLNSTIGGGIGGGENGNTTCTNGHCCVINVNCNCCNATNGTEPGTPGTPEPTDPCQAPDNKGVDGATYQFYQTFPYGKCNSDKEFYLWSPQFNSGVSSMDNTYHSVNSPTPNFNKGAAAARKMSSPATFNSFMDWTFDTTVSTALGLGGGQLKDKNGKCLGYSALNNFSVTETRIQVVDCVDATAVAADAEKQLWSIELSSDSDDLYYLRNICTDLVIKKVKSDCEHDLISGCKKDQFHFDLQLVTLSQCTDGGNMFNVNNCLWQVSPPF
jgi:hypothetical protein